MEGQQRANKSLLCGYVWFDVIIINNFQSKMKRLEKEFKNVQSDMKEEGVIPTIKQNLFHWELLVAGPLGSPYEGFKFLVDLDFPEQFPFKFPQVKFRTPIHHPNIKEGLICQQMLGEKEWLPNKKVKEIIETILGMLAHPDVTSAINAQAAKQVKQGTYFNIAREKAAKEAIK